MRIRTSRAFGLALVLTLVSCADDGDTLLEPDDAGHSGLANVVAADVGSCVDLDAAIRHWWPGNGTTAELVAGQDGVLRNGASFAAGRVGEAFALDGVDDYMETASSRFGAIPSLEIWIQTDATTGLTTVIDGGPTFWTWRIDVADGVVRYHHFRNGIGGYITLVGPSVADADFHHIVTTADQNAKTIELWVDGALVDSYTESDPDFVSWAFAADGDAKLGKGDTKDQPLSFFEGVADELTVYERPLTSSEIGALHGAGSLGKCPPADVQPPPPVGADFIEVPRTGQLFTVTSGDDGALRMGAEWPTPRLTDHGDGTVTDHLTGLMWTKETAPAGVSERGFLLPTLEWQEALDFVAGMNVAGDFGYTDWRLPNVNELESLLDYDNFEQALPSGHPFENFNSPTSRGGLPSVSYWTTTTAWSPAGGTSVLSMDIQIGQVYPKTPSNGPVAFVWAVRTAGSGTIDLPSTGSVTSLSPGDDADLALGVEWPEPRFLDNQDGTVTDLLTRLTWASAPIGHFGWLNGLSAVAGLNAGTGGLGGHTDWRMPNFRELRSLVYYPGVGASLPDAHPFNGLPTSAWSSTTFAGGLDEAWRVSSFSGGGGSVESKVNQFAVLPVRGPTELAANIPPTADAGGPYTGFEGTPVSFTGSGTDPDGGPNPLTFAWDFGDGTFAFSASADHPYSDDGTFDVTLTVFDGLATGTVSTTAVIANVAPTVQPLAGATLLSGETYVERGSFTDPGTADTWVGSVDYGDGSDATPAMLVGNTIRLEHVYTAPGTYTVTVTVTDDDGGVGSGTTTVLVQTPAQTVAAVEGDVADLVEAGVIARGDGNALRSNLSAARRQLERGNHEAAAGQLGAFINHVEAMDRTDRIPGRVAADLVAAAERILAVL